MGRPGTFTPAKRDKILALMREGISPVTARKVVNLTRNTIWVHRKKEPDFAEAYDAALERCDAARCERAEDALMTQVDKGNMAAIAFTLCNRAPGRWRQQLNVRQKVEGTLALTMKDWVAEMHANGQKTRKLTGGRN